jgi:hypothetical protein
VTGARVSELPCHGFAGRFAAAYRAVRRIFGGQRRGNELRAIHTASGDEYGANRPTPDRKRSNMRNSMRIAIVLGMALVTVFAAQAAASAATAIEYGLIAALIAVAAIA